MDLENDLDSKYGEAKALFNAERYAEAVPLLRTLAEKDHAKAQNNLGFCYEYGDGVPQDYTEAVTSGIK